MKTKIEILNEFISQNLSPTDAERKEISRRYDELSNLLQGRDFQSGSYARFTSITPVHDLDVIWVLPEDILTDDIRKSISLKISPDELEVEKILESLAKRLQEEYEKLGSNVSVKSQTHSVTIEFLENTHEFTIDVVPAVPTSKQNDFGDAPLYLVPEIIKDSHKKRVQKYNDKVSISWIKSDPEGYIREASEVDSKNNAFRKSSKFLKGWRRKSKNDSELFKLKAFHIEQLVMKYLHENPDSSTWDIVTFFFSNINDLVSEPQIPDRADKSIFIDAYIETLTDEEKSYIFTEAKEALTIMIKASEQDSESAVQDLLAEIVIVEDPSSIYPITKNYAPAKPWYSGDIF
jgi:tRNA nucleotidyltransferase (CCA-adding enzyme)